MFNMIYMAAEDNSKNLSWAVDIFTFIGIVVCIITAAIALVWLTCFVVRLLVKTFSSKINESYNVFVEDMKKKSESKKERNAKKREAKDAQKMELLNMKLESKARIHEMKKEKLQEKFNEKENTQREKLFGGIETKQEKDVASEIKEETTEDDKERTTKKKKENA